jgi:hypothetical protein
LIYTASQLISAEPWNTEITNSQGVTGDPLHAFGEEGLKIYKKGIFLKQSKCSLSAK